MFQENASVQRRPDGSIDHDHYRSKALRLRSQAMFDLFLRGCRAANTLRRIAFTPTKSRIAKNIH
jgi:hypothetical protein